MTIVQSRFHPRDVVKFVSISASIGSLMCLATAWGHHAARPIYFVDQTIEVQGEVTSVLWRNPHARFSLLVTEEDGSMAEWEVETIPVTRLTRVGVSSELLREGEIVTIAGYPARRDEHGAYATNLLLPDGREILLDTPIPRWTDNTLGTGTDNSPGEASADTSLGLFRVWSTDGRGFGARNPPLPFTEAAEAKAETWDPLADDNPFRGCTPKGMPQIMGQPNPISFENLGDRIILRIEEYDTAREILLEADPSQSLEYSSLGYSVGWWEGEALVVETSRISWPYFDQNGHIQSEEISLIERFTPSADGSRLDYELTISDPALFDEPVTRVRSWIWVPGAAVLPFECEESGSG